MSQSPPYQAFHPRWYRPRMSSWWWLKRRSHLAFALRELSSIFVAWFVIFFLLLVAAVSREEVAYREFLSWAGRPGILLLNLVSLLFVVFHAVTWFNLVPQALALRLWGRRVPGPLLAGSHYAAWAVVSGLVALLVLGG